MKYNILTESNRYINENEKEKFSKFISDEKARKAMDYDEEELEADAKSGLLMRANSKFAKALVGFEEARRGMLEKVLKDASSEEAKNIKTLDVKMSAAIAEFLNALEAV